MAWTTKTIKRFGMQVQEVLYYCLGEVKLRIFWRLINVATAVCVELLIERNSSAFVVIWADLMICSEFSGSLVFIDST